MFSLDKESGKKGKPKSETWKQSDIWGPHYWFFLMTIALSYPENPNAIIKRKYYDFLTNLPIFIPNPEIGDKFSRILDKYPISPYLDNRDSFVKWVHFIHNKINVLLGKPEITFSEAMDNYMAQYNAPVLRTFIDNRMKKYIIYTIVILSFLFLAYVLYK